MDKSSLLEDIFKSIEKIEEDYKVIKKKELVNELEIELFVSKTRYLYEKSIALKYISKFVNQNAESDNVVSTKISIPSIKEEFEDEIERTEEKDTLTEGDSLKENKLEEKEALLEDKKQEENVEEENIMDEEKINVEEVSNTSDALEDSLLKEENVSVSELAKKDEDVQQKIEQIADLNSKLRQENKTSLYERFSQLDKQGDLLNKFQQTPIEDLKKAVGLNERYLFSKALFNNEMSALIDALDKLNNMESFDDALKFISEEYDEKYNWKEHGEEQLLFINTIKRKFV